MKFTAGADLRQNTVDLATSWQSFGGKAQKVAISISRADAQAAGLGVYDGLGFAWNGKGYELVQDGYDTRSESVAKNLGLLKQRYNLAEVRRAAKLQGYTITEQAQADGTIRLVCNQY